MCSEMAAVHPKGAPHFTWAELGDPPQRLRGNARSLATSLEDLRRRCGGRPLGIISGYRDPAHNRRVGGAPFSQHLRAAAADLPEGYATVEEAVMSGFTGVGSKGPWAVHVDVRPGPLARWTYD